MDDDLKVNHREAATGAAAEGCITTCGNNGDSGKAIPPAGIRHRVSHIPPEVCRECLAAMTHRLVQPLTALRGGLELGVLGKPAASDYRALVQQSLELTDALTQMVVLLRNLGESAVSPGPVEGLSLDVFVRQAMGEVDPWAKLRDVALKFAAEGLVKVRANPERLRETLQSLLAWVIQNTAGGSTVLLELSTSGEDAQLFLSPPKMDWHYLRVKNLEEINIPGVLFSLAAKAGTLGWAINQRLVEGLGGTLEVLTAEGKPGRIRARFPLAPQT